MTFQAPMLALARWLEHAPAEHGPLLVDAVLGPQDVGAWSRSAIQPCGPCGFPPDVHSGPEAASRHLLANLALHPGASARPRTPYAYPEEDPRSTWASTWLSAWPARARIGQRGPSPLPSWRPM